MLFGAAASPTCATGTHGKGSAKYGPENEKEQVLFSGPPCPREPSLKRKTLWLACGLVSLQQLATCMGFSGSSREQSAKLRLAGLAAFNFIPFSLRILTPSAALGGQAQPALGRIPPAYS